MARKMIGALAPGIELTGDYIVRITALDPASGLVVADVNVTNVSMQVDAETADAGSDVKLLPPLYAHEA